AILAGELDGPREALVQLHKAQGEITRDPVDAATTKRLYEILETVYQYRTGERDPGAPFMLPGFHPAFADASVAAANRDLLREELGWYGDLALAPADSPDQVARRAVLEPAYRTTFVFLGAFILVGILGVGGLVALVPFLLALLRRKLQPGLGAPSPF